MKAILTISLWLLTSAPAIGEIDAATRTCSETIMDWYSKRPTYDFSLPDNARVTIVISKSLDTSIIAFMDAQPKLKDIGFVVNYKRWPIYAELSEKDILRVKDLALTDDADVFNSCLRLHAKIEQKCPYSMDSDSKASQQQAQRCINSFADDLLNWEARYNRQTARMMARDEINLIDDQRKAAEAKTKARYH